MLESRNKNGAINVLKFIFAIVTALFHSHSFTQDKSETLFYGGYLAVEFFFIVSGYLMAKSTQNKSPVLEEKLGTETLSFVFRKIRSILPYFIFSLIVGFVVRHAIDNVSLIDTCKDLLFLFPTVTFTMATGIEFYNLNSVYWYLSAMFISMMILYPLLRKKRDLFLKVLSPLITILLLARLSMTGGHLGNAGDTFLLLIPKMLRAIAEISFGCICYAIAQWIGSFKLKTYWKVGLTIVEIASYALALIIMQYYHHDSMDFICLYALAIGVTLTFSGATYTSSILTGKWTDTLSKFSVSLFLNHLYCVWALRKLGVADRLGYSVTLLVYLVVSFLVSILCMWLMDAISARIKRKASISAKV